MLVGIGKNNSCYGIGKGQLKTSTSTVDAIGEHLERQYSNVSAMRSIKRDSAKFRKITDLSARLAAL